MVKPETEREWTIHSINIHGVFFERWCQQVIRDADGWWLEDSNYPVAFPPRNKEGLEPKESALDVRASSEYRKGKLNLLIECKKNNPEFIDWIFFKKDLRTATEVQAIKDPRNPQTGPAPHYFCQPFRTLPIADEARETRGTYQAYSDQRSNKTKTSNTAVTDASRQVALATQAIVYEDWRKIRENQGKGEHEIQCFFPLIVTSANLFICNFNPKDVSEGTGEIPFDKVELEEMPYLIYEFPLPHHLQSTHLYPDKSSLNPYQLRQHTRLDIAVVNSRKFNDFLGFIKRHMDYFFF